MLCHFDGSSMEFLVSLCFALFSLCFERHCINFFQCLFQKSVRSEASRGIYKMCISGESSLLNDVLKLLLRNMPDLIASHESLRKRFPTSKLATSSYKDYFWLLSRLIDKLEIVLNDENQVDIEHATKMVADFICSHTLSQEPNPTSDYCLIGLLQTCTSLLRHEPKFKYHPDGCKLLEKVFSDCLFRLPSKSDNGELVRPTCETKSARSAAFDVLLKLAHSSETNYKEIQSLFFQVSDFCLLIQNIVIFAYFLF